MHTFFDQIDASRRYLLLGETDHDASKIQDFVFSKEFLRAAMENGYTKLLVEHPANSNPDFLRRELAIPKIPGMKIVGADFRSVHDLMQDYNGLTRWAENLNKTLLSFKNCEMELLIREFQNFRIFQFSKDQELLDKIKKEAEGTKIIVFYGAGHFAKDHLIETNLPKAERTIAFLHAKAALSLETIMFNPLNDDTMHYLLGSHKFAPLPLTERLAFLSQYLSEKLKL
jgi:hypothetical protein